MNCIIAGWQKNKKWRWITFKKSISKWVHSKPDTKATWRVWSVTRTPPAVWRRSFSKDVPDHQGNLHVVPRLEWSSPHLQSARVDGWEWPTLRFCLACGSQSGTRCSGPAALYEGQQPLSSAGIKGHIRACVTQQELGIFGLFFFLCVYFSK